MDQFWKDSEVERRLKRGGEDCLVLHAVSYKFEVKEGRLTKLFKPLTTMCSISVFT